MTTKTSNGVEVEDVETLEGVYGAEVESGELEDESGLVVSYTTVEDTGTTVVRITADFTTEIRQVMQGGKVVFVGDAFGGNHPTIKKALDAAGRNVISRAVAAAYEAANPKPEKATRTRAKAENPTREDIDAMIATATASGAAAAAELMMDRFMSILNKDKSE